jgi:hypothetical protein
VSTTLARARVFTPAEQLVVVRDGGAARGKRR